MKKQDGRRETLKMLTVSAMLALAGPGGAGLAHAASTRSVILDQANNPVYGLLGNYKSWLSKASDPAAALAADRAKADNIITWQMPHGGFYKDPSWYAAPWNGTAKRSGWTGANGVELGTIDNQATVSEILFLADVYRRSGVAKYRDSARKALDFLLTMQVASGGFPQVYPARTGTGYSNYVTFNDDAMVRVLVLFDQAGRRKAPLDGSLFSSSQLGKLEPAIEKAVGFILKAQIVQGGLPTVWCAQHDPVSYVPRGARSYELPSKSGSESARIVQFLMSRPQTPAVETAVRAALAWYRNPRTQIFDTIYDRGAQATNTSPFVQKIGAPPLWYRFYDLDMDTGFFSGRLPTDNPPGTGKQYDIMRVEPERRYGYQWAGEYGKALLAYAAQVGY